ncbi:MAG: cytochrome c [Betaproteobacteria bacterium]|nr:MAG: cytochrome c [Betaproteobacteria bacterium]
MTPRRCLAAATLVLAVAGTAWVALPGRHAAATPDGCVACHADVSGLGAWHAPQRIGCAACHLGDAGATDASSAHAGLLTIPGNLADAPRTCGRSECHASVVPRVERSIMTTMAGVIATNRRVLGDDAAPAGGPPHPGVLGDGVADSHLRELCVGCHLGQPKTARGPIGEQSPGGGCNACHLDHAARDEPVAAGTRRHPALTLTPRNGHCFGCHSRSGRAATNYEGWLEIRGEPPGGLRAEQLRRLQDGRFLRRVQPDVHHERGLECVDCHTARELMGGGETVADKRGQLRIVCSDCHAARLASVPADRIDAESALLLALRRWHVEPGQRLGTTRQGDVLVNVFVDGDGRGWLRRKRTGAVLPLAPPAEACNGDPAHARLACTTCHSAWAPRCPTCHTSYDPAGEGFDHRDQRWRPGTWNETAGPFEAAQPTLGVHRDASGREEVQTFVPGMVMTFDRNRGAQGPPDVVFRRLYAMTFAHTIRREARSCASCHRDPLALGYGRGTLRSVRTAQGAAWRFVPDAAASPHDGLPADAWIGFLRGGTGMLSTRDDVRPFDVGEQRRVLAVGACLGCHAGDAPVMRAALRDVAGTFARRSPRCLVPNVR